MKRIISLIIWLAFLAWSNIYAQDITLDMGNTGYTNYTMTTTADTLDINLGGSKFVNYYTILAKSTVSDSVLVEIRVADSLWCQQALLDLSTGSNVLFISATTTAKQYQLLDPAPKKVRFRIEATDSANVVILVERKYKP